MFEDSTAACWKSNRSSVGNFPPDENYESSNENDPEKTSDEVTLRLFNSDTKGDGLWFQCTGGRQTLCR